MLFFLMTYNFFFYKTLRRQATVNDNNFSMKTHCECHVILGVYTHIIYFIETISNKASTNM